GPGVLWVKGEGGVGKTVFAKGVGAGLDIDPAEVNSPTFTILNRHEGRMRMYHLDLYRIEGGADEVYSLGLDEMLSEGEVVVVVEWPERLGAFAIPKAYRVVIEDLGGDERSVSIRHDV